jgi:hypothetical protein
MWTVPMSAGTSLNTLAVANIDEDSELEVVAVTPEATAVLNAASGMLEWSLPVGGAATIDRARKQLVLATGSQVRVYDLKARSLVKTLSTNAPSLSAWTTDIAQQRLLFATLESGGLLVIDFESGRLVGSFDMERQDLFTNASAVPTLVQGRSATFFGQSNFASHRMDLELTIRPLFENGFE